METEESKPATQIEQLLIINRVCNNLAAAMSMLSAAQADLADLEGAQAEVESLEQILVAIESMGIATGDKGEKLMETLSGGTRCPGCPGTEGGCCK